MRLLEHPDGVYVPVGECQGCHIRTLLDGQPGAWKVRPHNEQRLHIRHHYEVQAAKAGKRYANYPACPGGNKIPVLGSVSMPPFYFADLDD